MSEENQPVEEVETPAPVAEVEAPISEEQPEVETAPEENQDSSHNSTNSAKRVRRKRAYESENERLKEQIAQMQSQTQPPVQQQAPVRDHNAPATLDQYDDTEEYMDVKVRQVASQMLQEQAHQTQQQQVLNTFSERMAEYEKTNPEIRDDVKFLSNKVSPAVESAILNSESGPKLAEMLSTDSNLLNRLNRLDPVSVGREVYKLEEQAKVQPSLSSAPAPIDSPKTSVKSNGSSPSGLSFAEHTALMNKKMYG